ncbi:sigma-54-dependent transcriptional regulator [Desulfovibrio ferrophilus]|uniref:CheY-like receiver, AAA-type ATPase, and DNA-binding domain containing response regulator n=1 Tax=Desulfovibrio ferrophilus TaxID=241368 RepID=A0A2Z6AY20_9BACT|nr:sigma-54 dependent transcriptional regulator [Desulfovibrio ferrophilus]BBD08093.1 CheY-like receiver, AAA-type ATPase, and DNA-binding domain containing response regulator [Desulfovibrio ferrophilus]
MNQVLAVTGNQDARQTIKDCFGLGATVHSVTGQRELDRTLASHIYDLVFIDISFIEKQSAGNGRCSREGLQRLWNINPHIIIVVLSEQDRIRDAVKAVKEGADNYLTYPIDPAETNYIVDSILEAQRLQTEVDYFRSTSGQGEHSEVVGTRNPQMRTVFEKARLVAPTISTVLLSGETGTGKGVIARLIHTLSNRKEGPFVNIHCGAIPDTLVESELFGHEKGSFTGAIKRKLGRFEIASGGTIFLDEVGTVSTSAQIKLLQVLQERIFQRVGGDSDIPMDARIVAATNIDLQSMCERGEFRQDLFYRLNVFPIEIPPLRERREDIPLLTENFLKRLSRIQLKDILGIHPLVLKAFEHYPWPGNVRELENLVERAFILETSRILTPESFPAELFEKQSSGSSISLDMDLTLAEFRERAKESAERHYLKELLSSNQGRINKSANQAGISTRQLHKLMTRHGLHKEDFK